ncbi:hypothetical protein SteCoe_14808 [Stentor coeruleus]|uniref:TatD related DNase n=1 Tax=Stentor coeruleus TaxID=5963 RepID=A0A1R2C518_9CILI|nr:hypothetical protein SteCoe_14808 [Stentor coeruleus]
MRKLIDSHCHLQCLTPKALSETLMENTTIYICNATNENDWDQVISLKSEKVIPCIGIHPWYVSSLSPTWLEKLHIHLQNPDVQIGEIGLDNCKSKIAPKKLQEQIFRSQLQLALEYNKVVNIHCVSAYGKVANILQEYIKIKQFKVLMHSWEGPWEVTSRLLRMFGPNIVFSLSMVSVARNKHVDVVQKLSDENIVIETDSPSQIVTSLVESEEIEYEDGKAVNKPKYLKYVLQTVARIRETSEDALAERLEQNFNRIFFNA